MASAMGFFDKFLASSPEKAAIADLAELAGRKEALIARLERHAGKCSYINIRTGLERLAINQAESFRTLRSILSDHDTWPRPPEAEPHEGSNNWERLSSDLELLRTIAIGMQKAVGTWEAVDSGIAEKLMPVATSDGEAESELRSLALKCDPQALD